MSKVTQQAADPGAEDSRGCTEARELERQPIPSKHPLLRPGFGFHSNPACSEAFLGGVWWCSPPGQPLGPHLSPVLGEAGTRCGGRPQYRQPMRTPGPRGHGCLRGRRAEPRQGPRPSPGQLRACWVLLRVSPGAGACVRQGSRGAKGPVFRSGDPPSQPRRPHDLGHARGSPPQPALPPRKGGSSEGRGPPACPTGPWRPAPRGGV